MIMRALFALGVSVVPAICSAAPIIDSVSGTSRWNFTMEVTDYFAGTATLPGARQVGDKVTKLEVATYTGVIERDFYGPGQDWHSYEFSNGWSAVSDVPTGLTVPTSCGFLFNYCIGGLDDPKYEIVESYYDLISTITAETGGPTSPGGFPVSWKVVETVILQNMFDSSDYHYFEARGSSQNAFGISAIPLPAPVFLLGGALLMLGFGSRLAGRKGRAVTGTPARSPQG